MIPDFSLVAIRAEIFSDLESGHVYQSTPVICDPFIRELEASACFSSMATRVGISDVRTEYI